ncbi:integrase core domain-containing protein [Streptomyces sp. NPDC007856]|uniref:integrase core domain-containing protein n=1 Tax=Streptomyces sp. NPDC007856 TaxID=3364781 RepID=UPI0036AFD980
MVRYTDRLAEVGVAASVGSVADSYDNAMAEALNGTFKAELIEMQGPWRDVDQVERAIFQWVTWYNRGTAPLHPRLRTARRVRTRVVATTGSHPAVRLKQDHGLYETRGSSIRPGAELPPEVRVILHFTGETMPAQWLEAVRQNGESYSSRDQSVAMEFQSLSPALATELPWGIERQVQLGMNIDAEATAKPRLTTAAGLSAGSGCGEQGREAGGQPGPRAPGEDLPPGDGTPGI